MLNLFQLVKCLFVCHISYKHIFSDQSVVLLQPSGLLRLEELVRRFLISRETLSVRMLDESLDPTPLLKEIRDDKVATIIIDANASISYLILRKVTNTPWNYHTLNTVIV